MYCSDTFHFLMVVKILFIIFRTIVTLCPFIFINSQITMAEPNITVGHQTFAVQIVRMSDHKSVGSDIMS